MEISLVNDFYKNILIYRKYLKIKNIGKISPLRTDRQPDWTDISGRCRWVTDGQ